MYGIIRNGTSICFSFDYDNDGPILRKFICNTTNDILIEDTISLKNNSVDFMNLEETKTFLINNRLYFLRFPKYGEFAIVVADETYTHIYNYSQDNFVTPLMRTIESIYPNGEGTVSINFTNWPYTAFEKNGNIYMFIMCNTEGTNFDANKIYKPGLIKINPSNGEWSFINLNGTQIYLDTPDVLNNIGIIDIIIIESNMQTYLYVSFMDESYNRSLYIYTIDIVDGQVVTNRRNYFDNTPGHEYVEFKYGDSTARCYPMNGAFQWNSNLNCYTFGTNSGHNINHQEYVDVGDGQATVNFSNGLLSNSGKANYIIGNYYNGSYTSNTRRFLARLGSLDLTPHPENQVVLFG